MNPPKFLLDFFKGDAEKAKEAEKRILEVKQRSNEEYRSRNVRTKAVVHFLPEIDVQILKNTDENQ